MKHSKQDNLKQHLITCVVTQLIIFKRCKNTTRYGKKMIFYTGIPNVPSTTGPSWQAPRKKPVVS